MFRLEPLEPRRASEYQTILGDAEAIREYSGYDDHSRDSFEEDWLNPELPPGGSLENLFRLGLVDQDTGRTLGLLEYYRGYPGPRDVFLGHLYIKKEFQGQGYGKEAVALLRARLTAEGSTDRILLNVAARNFPALWFWFGQGFGTITALHGDKTGGTGRFLDLTLASQTSTHPLE